MILLPRFYLPRQGPDRERALQRYRDLAQGYDATCTRIERVRLDAIEALNLRPGETVFDVACGTGKTLIELAHRVGPTGHVVGIEQSPEMTAIARTRIASAGLQGRVEMVMAPAEEANLTGKADAMLFCFTQDVLQCTPALMRLAANAASDCRVALVGVRLQPWWYAWPVNLFMLVRSRHCFTTTRGLRAPWAPLARLCERFAVVRSYHAGMTYLAVGRLRGGEPRTQRDKSDGLPVRRNDPSHVYQSYV